MSEYGEGYDWSRGRFGEDGPALRRFVAELMFQVHEHFAETQEHAESSDVVVVNTRDVYGRLWRPLLDTFATQLPARFPTAVAWKPAGSQYRVVKVNDWLIYPLRCDRRTDEGFQLGDITPLRRRMLSGDVLRELHPMLPFGPEPAELPAEAHAELTTEDEELLERYRTLRAAADESTGVMGVIMGSNPQAVHSLEWGEVTPRGDGMLTFTGFHEDLTWARGGGGGGWWPRWGDEGGGPVRPDRGGPAGGGFAAGAPSEPPMQVRGSERALPDNTPPAGGNEAKPSEGEGGGGENQATE